MIASQMVGRALLFAFSTTATTAFAPSTALARMSGVQHRSITITHTGRFVSSVSADTPVLLPDFSSQQEYLDYLQGASGLPKGFATGSADGSFVSVEAPSMGDLKIRGTIISLTEGPTDNWAAVFTTNKVSAGYRLCFVPCVLCLSNCALSHLEPTIEVESCHHSAVIDHDLFSLPPIPYHFFSFQEHPSLSENPDWQQAVRCTHWSSTTRSQTFAQGEMESLIPKLYAKPSHRL